ncbi:MAG: hypothetical protein KatS3mg076_0652 [Candidatus Binatia bacterium]|nr:MAG: hypothetical protein KatS3mg076_0652 [Candidatus Binatia bacterium]
MENHRAYAAGGGRSSRTPEGMGPRKAGWRYLAAGFCFLLAAASARAETVVSDQPAALLAFPGVIAGVGSMDTLIQITNVSDTPARLACFYVNALGRCSVSGEACFAGGAGAEFGFNCPDDRDLCLPQWVETDFRVVLTSRQPFAWRVSTGLPRSAVPLDGVFRRGPRGESNAGTDIPPFEGIGELKCYVVDPNGSPADRNVLVGSMTIVAEGDAFSHNAIGFRAVPGANDGDNELVLGGDSPEYDGCPNVLVADHFFTFAENPVTGEEVFPLLVLAPCSQNFLTQVPTRVNVQYLVFNEFEQRFSTSRPVECLGFEFMAFLDTTDPDRSIFSVFVSGTLTGQTRIRPVDGGLVGWLFEVHGSSAASVNLHHVGRRETADRIVVP